MTTATGTATARAHPNIALVKYWGKADEQLMLPSTGSLSLTLDAVPTTTTVALDAGAEADRLELGGRLADAAALGRVVRLLDLVRERAGTDARAVVRSRNEAPTGAGLASSASGFAALAVAAAAAYGLELDERALSRLARRGSGSAARSICAGLSVWHAGDDEASFAEPIEGPELRMIAVLVAEEHKPVSSRDAMRRTAATSPFTTAWIESTAASLDEMRAACRDGDVARIGRITETNALRMHAVIQAAEPPIRYLAPGSIAVFDAAERLRAEGLQAWATADAGPNVVLVTTPEDAAAVEAALRELDLGGLIVAGPGPGAMLLDADEAVAAIAEADAQGAAEQGGRAVDAARTNA